MATTSLDSLYALKHAGSYTSPARQSDVLPVVFGDMTENSGNEGVIPCVKLNTSTYVYALAGHAVVTTANGNTFRFFDADGTEITSGYTVNPSHNYESQGTIATVTFTSNVGEITAQFQGMPDATGALITNPITVFETIVGSASSLHRTSAARATQIAADLGYTCAGAIVTEQPYKVWLNDLAASFLMDWLITADGELKIRVDSASLIGLVPSFFLRERESGPVIGMQTTANLLNQPQVSYAISYAQSDRRYREGVRAAYLKFDDGSSILDANSQRRFGERKQIFELNWTRNTATVTTIQQRLVSKFKAPVWLIQWPELTLQAMQADLGDYGVYSWQERKNATGAAVTNQYCQLLEKEVLLDDGSLGLLLLDLGMTYSSDVDLWNGTDATLGDGGTW